MGAGSKTEVLKNILSEHGDEYRVEYFIENIRIEKIGTYSKNAAKIISFFDAIKLYEDKKIDCFMIPAAYSLRDYQGMYEQLITKNVHAADIFIVPAILLKKAVLDEQEFNDLFTTWDKFSQIEDLQVHVNDHCNLNCSSCCHFSNLIKNDCFMDEKKLKKDLLQIKGKIKYINKVVLLGGEPLLNARLPEYIRFIYENFLYSEKNIVTNGLLLFNMSDDLINAIRETDTLLSVSLYGVMESRTEEMVNYLKNLNIRFEINPQKEFGKRLSLEPRFTKSAQYCGQCCTLRDGKIMMCPELAYIKYFNEYFNVNLPVEEGVDIYDECISGSQLYHIMRQPKELCKHCTGVLYEDFEPWTYSKNKEYVIEDYLTSF